MSKTAIFARLTKVDVAKREVHGVAAASVVDHSNEILDYATSKPFFEKWSANAHTQTDGKSVGNLRVMHKNDVAGKLTSLMFNDAAEQIEVIAKVVDDNEWRKVQEGCYTGFSIGGSYKNKWDDPVHKGVKRYTADPVEVSLVDLPCIPTATFSVVKADGSTLQKSFAPAAQESGESGAASESASGGDTSSAAGADSLSKVNALFSKFAAIIAAPKEPMLKRFGDALLTKYKAGDEALVKAVDMAMTVARPELEKGLYTVDILLDALRDLKCADSDMMMAAAFGDDQSTPESMSGLKAVMNDLVALIVGMLQGEMSDGDDDSIIIELSKPKGDLTKTDNAGDAPAPNGSQAPVVQKAEPATDDPLTKALEPINAELKKLRDESEETKKLLAKRDGEIMSLASKLKRPAAHAVTKGAEGLGGTEDRAEKIDVVRGGDGEIDLAATVFKATHAAARK